MYRGSIDSDDAIYKKDVNTGETTAVNDVQAEVTAVNFGDIYATYQVKRLSDDKVMLNSFDKNPINAANRQYYFYSFWVTSASDVTPGEYEISLTLNANPLAPKGLLKKMNINMIDSSETYGLKRFSRK